MKGSCAEKDKKALGRREQTNRARSGQVSRTETPGKREEDEELKAGSGRGKRRRGEVGIENMYLHQQTEAQRRTPRRTKHMDLISASHHNRLLPRLLKLPARTSCASLLTLDTLSHLPGPQYPLVLLFRHSSVWVHIGLPIGATAPGLRCHCVPSRQISVVRFAPRSSSGTLQHRTLLPLAGPGCVAACAQRPEAQTTFSASHTHSQVAGHDAPNAVPTFRSSRIPAKDSNVFSVQVLSAERVSR